MGDGGGRHCLARMEWRPAEWSVCLTLLIFPCTIKSRSSLLAPSHPNGPGKRAVKQLCVCVCACVCVRDVAMATNFGQNRQKYHKNGHNFSCIQDIHAVWFWDRICSIAEFATWHFRTLGTKGVTMATNFGTKIGINAFVPEITRMWLFITGGFCVQPIQGRHFCVQGSKGRCHGDQILAKICKISQKWP